MIMLYYDVPYRRRRLEDLEVTQVKEDASGDW
jgi:hypothetical protein